MKRSLLLSLLLLSGTSAAEAQTSPVSVTFQWVHDGKDTTGFRIYKGPATNALAKVVDVPGGAAVRSFAYNGNENLPVCFGVSAYGPLGESAVVSKNDAGVDVCLGKPAAPTSFSFSAP